MNHTMRFSTIGLAVALSGCAPMGTNPRDPFEGFNRTMFTFNDKVDQVALKPLTDNKNDLVTFVNGFSTYAWTAGHLGVQWGWNIVAEDFGSVWGGNSVPGPYSDTQGSKPKLVKAMILMTDGIFNTAYHYDTGRNQALALCTAMKAKGVRVFTIGLGMGTTPGELVAKDTLRQCASNSQSFVDARNSNELDAALQQFASILGNLRVTK